MKNFDLIIRRMTKADLDAVRQAGLDTYLYRNNPELIERLEKEQQ